MKKRIFLTIGLFAVGVMLAITGCQAKQDASPVSQEGTGTPHPNLAKATPPPNFDTKGLEAQNKAAKAAADAIQKSAGK